MGHVTGAFEMFAILEYVVKLVMGHKAQSF